MNYELEVQKSLPVSFHTFNGTRPPLVVGSSGSELLTSSTTLPWKAFVQSRENQPFSMECWFLPVEGNVVVMGHATDGVIFDGSKFTLAIDYAGETISADWTPQELKSFHLVLTYDTTEFILYADNVAVVTLSVLDDLFVSTHEAVTFNGSTGSGIYDAAAIYYRALPAQEVKLHYEWGLSIRDAKDIASSAGGSTWALSYDHVDIYQSTTFNSSNWSEGFSQGVSSSDLLIADDISGGSWQVALPLEGIISGTVAGVQLTHSSYNVNMSYSTDATTWIPIENKTTVLEDTGSTDLTLYIKLDLVDDSSWVESLKIDIINDRILSPYSGTRELTFKGASLDQTPAKHIEYQADHGADIESGYLQIEPDPSDTPENIKSLEVWARIDSTSGRLVRFSATEYADVSSGNISLNGGVTAYRNGSSLANGAAVNIGLWDHYVFIAATAINTAIRVANSTDASPLPADCSIGHLAAYPDIVDASELYSSNINSPTLRVSDASVIRVSEVVDTPTIYAAAWTNGTG